MGIFLSFFYERIFGPSTTDLKLSYKRQKDSTLQEQPTISTDKPTKINRRLLPRYKQKSLTFGDFEQEERIYKCLSDFHDELQEIIRRHLSTLELITVTIGDSKQEERIYECLSDFVKNLQEIVRRHLFEQELRIVTIRDSKPKERIHRIHKYLSDIYGELEEITDRHLILELRTMMIRDFKQEERIYKYLSDFHDELQEIIRRHLSTLELITVTIGDFEQEERIYECLSDFSDELQKIIRRHLFEQKLRTVIIRDRDFLYMPEQTTEQEKVAEAVISSSTLFEESPTAANTDRNTAILDSFINPTNIELQLSCTEYVDPIESGESTSVQSQDFPMPSLTSHPNPVFSPNWQTVKEFTDQGGQLRREKSEVVLHVPNGAVRPCVPVLIKGAISIDFQKVHSTLDLAADETVVSPVAEYDAGQNCFFQKPICVLLPHFLPPSFCQDYVSVLTFHKDDDGKISTHKMSLLTTSKEEDFYDKFDGQNGFYFTKSGAICVLTYHFSGFLCTYCRTNIEFSPVHLSLYAICRQQERKNVKVCLIMWDKRLHMQDFETQVLTNQEREMKSIQKDKLSMITENVEVREVGAFMDIPESHKETWIHTAIDDFPIAQTKNLGDVLCSCVNSIPVKIWWSLHDVPCECPTTYFKCSIKVGYINMTATRKTTDLFNFCNSPTKQIFEVDDLKPQSAETESPAYVYTRMHNQINHQNGCLNVYLENAKYVNISPVNNGSENSNSAIEISR